MKNYKTTIGAVVSALTFILPLFGVPIPPEVANAGLALAIFIVAMFAKDSNVTGGTKSQTKEAENRVTGQG